MKTSLPMTIKERKAQEKLYRELEELGQMGLRASEIVSTHLRMYGMYRKRRRWHGLKPT